MSALFRRRQPYVVRYAASNREVWDEFVDNSRNGTFLFRRDYMEYHRDRFADFSLVITTGEHVSALFPANRNGDTVISHAGLTFGGLILDRRATTERVVAMLSAIIELLQSEGIRTLIYKTIPTIYHHLPTEEDRYALFNFGAEIIRRDVLTAICPISPWQPSPKRRWSWDRSKRLTGVDLNFSYDWSSYWRLLRGRLLEQYGVLPVHSLEEISSLAAKFPAAIRLLAATINGEMSAGVVLYESTKVVRTQYLAANSGARACGLLDFVLRSAIEDARIRRKWFDFGSSTGSNGNYLNVGLAHYKESFGGRTVVQDSYRLDLPARRLNATLLS
jgi:hypothetical protein